MAQLMPRGTGHVDAFALRQSGPPHGVAAGGVRTGGPQLRYARRALLAILRVSRTRPGAKEWFRRIGLFAACGSGRTS